MPVHSPYSARIAAVPVRQRAVEVLGAVTRYWEYGDADAAVTLLLVHGFRGDHHGLEPVVGHLGPVRVIAPDLPGFGRSAPLTRTVHDLPGYANWLREFIRVAGLEDAVVLGHSFGSIVASAAVAAGARPAALVLVNPIAAPALAGPRGLLTRLAVLYYRLGAALPDRLGLLLLRNRVIVRGMSVAMAKTRDPALRRWIHDQHHRYFSSFADRRVVLEAFRASVSADVSHFAPDIPTRTLLVAADRDDITPLEAQRRLLGLFPHARLTVIRGVGHLIHYEAPDEAAEAIGEFLSIGGAR